MQNLLVNWGGEQIHPYVMLRLAVKRSARITKQQMSSDPRQPLAAGLQRNKRRTRSRLLRMALLPEHKAVSPRGQHLGV